MLKKLVFLGTDLKLNFMNTSTPVSQTFQIDYRGKTYICDRIERNKNVLYRVTFPNSYLYLAQAAANSGEAFWTAIPQDPKLKQVAMELGEIIGNYPQ